MGIAEGTASLFVDSWRAGNCPAALEREIDPCSMSQLNSECCPAGAGWAGDPGQLIHARLSPQRCVRRPTARCWCRRARCLRTATPPWTPSPSTRWVGPWAWRGPWGDPRGSRRTLMATVCPQRCVYQACNYEETFPHICAALGDYALACASRGVLLQGWRSSVDNCSAWGGRDLCGGLSGVGGACVVGGTCGGGQRGAGGVCGACGWAWPMGAGTAGGRGLRGGHRGRLPRICLLSPGPPQAFPAQATRRSATTARPVTTRACR